MAFSALSLIGPALGLAGSLFGSKSASKSAEKSQQRSDYWNQVGLDFAREQYEEGIQTRVKDAKAAGLHPLFALGGGAGGSSGVSFMSGQHPTGSGIGSGLARAGQAISAGVSGHLSRKQRAAEQAVRAPLLAAQVRSANASAARDEAAAAATHSEIKRKEAQALMGPRPEPPWDQQGRQVLGPTAARAALEGANRPTVVGPYQSPTEFARTETGVKILNPDMNMDELGQGYYALQKARGATTDALMSTHNWWKRRQHYKQQRRRIRRQVNAARRQKYRR